MGTQSEVDLLRAEIEDLRAQLDDAQDALRAIHSGEVDALVVQTPRGDQVYALEGALELYRAFVEQMPEGAAAVSPNGLILYANRRLADITGLPHERLVGASIDQILGNAHRSIDALISGVLENREAEVVLTRGDLPNRPTWGRKQTRKRANGFLRRHSRPPQRSPLPPRPRRPCPCRQDPRGRRPGPYGRQSPTVGIRRHRG
jgi:PAS domain-containing protein